MEGGHYVEIIYSDSKVENQCTSIKNAQKLFGGNKALALSLHARIAALSSAEIIKDIIVQPQFRFHELHDKGKNKYKGYFAIDVKTKKEPWRIILRPLDDNKKTFDPCNIDEIAGTVEIVEIKEVSNHYE